MVAGDQNYGPEPTYFQTLTPAGDSYTLGRIEAKVGAMHEDVKEIRAHNAAVENRLRACERKVYLLMRIGAGAGMIITGGLAALGFK